MPTTEPPATPGPLEALRAVLGDTTWESPITRLSRLEAAANELLGALDGALVLEPCHVTGMHDPTHTPRYLCETQRADVYDRVLAAVGMAQEAMPRRLHDNCGWCHRVPEEEQRRQQARELHEWAGVPVPPELAEPAPDEPRPDDQFWILALIAAAPEHEPGGWRSYGAMNSHHAHPDQLAPPYRGRRFAIAVGELEELGLLEVRPLGHGGRAAVRPTDAGLEVLADA